MEVVMIDLKKCNLFKDFGWDRLEWQKRIRVAKIGTSFDDDGDDDEVLKCNSQYLKGTFGYSKRLPNKLPYYKKKKEKKLLIPCHD